MRIQAQEEGEESDGGLRQNKLPFERGRVKGPTRRVRHGEPSNERERDKQRRGLHEGKQMGTTKWRLKGNTLNNPSPTEREEAERQRRRTQTV